MRLHTQLAAHEIRAALDRAKKRGLVSNNVYLVKFERHGSRTHPISFEVQLGSEVYCSIPEPVARYGNVQKTRRRSQNGKWAATWREWGWFMAEIFDADPNARFGNKSWGYDGRDDFDQKTDYEFCLD